jgi:hypothetical protein
MSEIKIEKSVTITLDTKQVKFLNILLCLADEDLVIALRKNEPFHKGNSIHDIREWQEFGEDLRSGL